MVWTQWVISTLVPDTRTEMCKDAQRFCMVNLSHDLLQFDEPFQVIWILLTTFHEMSGSRKWRGALACVLWASVVGCFLTTGTTINPPRSVKLRGLPPGVDAGKTNSFWVPVQNAASRSKTDAQTYVESIVALADSHMKSSKVVDRDAAIQNLIRSMEKTGLLTLVLGGKNLGKTFLKKAALQRCCSNVVVLSEDMRNNPGASLLDVLLQVTSC